MNKNMLLRLTAAEFLVAMLMSLAAVEAYDCHPVFILGLIASMSWFVIFAIANGIIN